MPVVRSPVKVKIEDLLYRRESLNIYADEPVLECLAGIPAGRGGRGGNPRSRSARIGSALQMPENVLDGLAHSVGDAEPGVCTQLGGVDRAGLAARIHAMGMAQRLAILEAVDRWWLTGGDAAQRMAAAGMRVARAPSVDGGSHAS